MSQDTSFQRLRGTSCEIPSPFASTPLRPSTALGTVSLLLDCWKDTSQEAHPKPPITNTSTLEEMRSIHSLRLQTSQQKMSGPGAAPRTSRWWDGSRRQLPSAQVALSPMLPARLCSASPDPASSGSEVGIWDSNPSHLSPEFLPLCTPLSASLKMQVYLQPPLGFPYLPLSIH